MSFNLKIRPRDQTTLRSELYSLVDFLFLVGFLLFFSPQIFQYYLSSVEKQKKSLCALDVSILV